MANSEIPNIEHLLISLRTRIVYPPAPNVAPRVRAYIETPQPNTPSEHLEHLRKAVAVPSAEPALESSRGRELAKLGVAMVVFTVIAIGLVAVFEYASQPLSSQRSESTVAGSDENLAGSDPSPDEPIGSQPASQDTAYSPVVWFLEDDLHFAEGCGPTEIVGLVRGYLEAYNAGDQERLRSLFPTGLPDLGASPQERLDRYVVVLDGEQQFFTYDPEALFPYFAERHAQNEQLELRELHIMPLGSGATSTGVDQAAFFEFKAILKANDLSPRIFVGQGTLNCERGWLISWRASDEIAWFPGLVEVNVP